MNLKSVGLIALISAYLLLGLSDHAASAKEIEWQSYEVGMARGKSENKKIFLHFYARWCSSCKVMTEKTFKDPGVIASLNENFIPIKVDVDKERQASDMFKIRVLPDTWFIAENTEIIGHRPGYIPLEQMKTILKMLLERDGAQ